jgi:hypothetical protein
MDYQTEMKAIIAAAKSVDSGARRLRWNTARTVPDPIRRTAEARNEKLKADSEAYRRNRSEHQRVIAEMIAEETAARRLTAAVARWQLEPRIPELDQRYRAFVTRCRRDTSLSMPDALDRLDPAAMLTYHLLTETLRPAIATASAAVLSQRYAKAMETKDARSRIEAELIEERVEYGGLAASEGDLSIVRALTLYISEAQELRIQFSIDETRAIEDTIETARKSVNMAELAQVRPVDASHPAHIAARQAFEAEAGAYAEAVEAAALAAAAGE